MDSNDLIDNAKELISRQSHKKTIIDGVKIIHLTTHITEDGSFTELFRCNDTTQAFTSLSDFTIAQINRSVMLPKTIKAWHLHFHQDEVWSVSTETRLLLGLWDVRASSPTRDVTMRIPLSPDIIVYIPRGVAHGAANHMTRNAEILYIVNNTYNANDPDEHRLPWDAKGSNFWELRKE